MGADSVLTATNAPLWVTASNHGPLVSVVAWFLAVTAFLAVFARVATRYAVIRQVRQDDVVIVIALILAIGQSIATSIQASNGVGRHMAAVSPGRLTHLEKSNYASGILYIGALSMIKISACIHLNSLTPIIFQKQLVLGVGAFICLWTVSSILVVAFQCRLPHPWESLDGQKCINITGFWTSFHIVNILTELALTVLPWMILSNLQIKKSRKAIVIGCFTARVMSVCPIVIAAVIVQLYFLQSRVAHSQDMTFDLWTVVLLTSIVQALCLITTCIPYLKPFMSALETGMLRAEIDAPSTMPGFGYANRFTKDYIKSGRSSKPASKSQLTDLRMSYMGFSGVKRTGDHGQMTTISSKVPSPDSDNDSQTSQSKIIRKTVGWSVTEEPQIPPNTHLEYPSRTDIARAV